MTTGLREAAYGGPSVFVESAGRRIPPPLRIIKREDKGKASQGGPRKLSSETDESFGSAPEPPGGDAPITIPKRRSQGGSSSPGWLSKENERLATPVYDLEHKGRALGLLSTIPPPSLSWTNNPTTQMYPQTATPPVLGGRTRVPCLDGLNSTHWPLLLQRKPVLCFQKESAEHLLLSLPSPFRDMVAVSRNCLFRLPYLAPASQGGQPLVVTACHIHHRSRAQTYRGDTEPRTVFSTIRSSIIWSRRSK